MSKVDVKSMLSIDPGGIVAISRRLSGAIPPDDKKFGSDTPEGLHQMTAMTHATCLHPFRVLIKMVQLSGGVASLNHRLISVTPSGSVRSTDN